MEPVIEELLKLGWQGVVVAVVILVARLLGPLLQQVLPGWLSERSKREDLLMEALRRATEVMTETVAVLQTLRAEVSEVRSDQSELRDSVAHIAGELDLPRPRRKARPKPAEGQAHE